METNQSIGNEKIQKVVGFIALLPFIILILTSVAIFLFQLYLIAKYGSWVGISIVDLITYVVDSTVGIDINHLYWLEHNWLGIYKILQWLPASLTLFILSWVVLFLVIKIIDAVKEQ